MLILTITLQTVVSASHNQISSDLADEIAILSTTGGVYYGLNRVGAFIWRMIQEPISVTLVRDAMMEAFEVDSERCERDLLALLNDLDKHELIDVH